MKNADQIQMKWELLLPYKWVNSCDNERNFLYLSAAFITCDDRLWCVIFALAL